MDTLLTQDINLVDDIQMFESPFLNERTKRVNDDIFAELSFELVKSSRISRSLDRTYEVVLNALKTQILRLVDVQTLFGDQSEIMKNKYTTEAD